MMTNNKNDWGREYDPTVENKIRNVNVLLADSCAFVGYAKLGQEISLWQISLILFHNCKMCGVF